VAAFIRSVVSDHLGTAWSTDQFLDLTDRGSHPCGIFFSRSLSVFAKLSSDPLGMELFDAELKGLALLHGAGAKTPSPLGAGAFSIDDRSVLLCEALTERHGQERTVADWRRMGQALGHLHLVTGPRFGLREFDGFFGPLHQDNRPAGTTWAEFYAERRLRPRLREAVDSGDLPGALAQGVDSILARM
jgi:fructosamine-3-kinase